MRETISVHPKHEKPAALRMCSCLGPFGLRCVPARQRGAQAEDFGCCAEVTQRHSLMVVALRTSVLGGR